MSFPPIQPVRFLSPSFLPDTPGGPSARLKAVDRWRPGEDAAVNEPVFPASRGDQVVVRLRDLRLVPTPLLLALIGCAVPLLVLGLASRSWLDAAMGLLLLGLAVVCLCAGIATLRGLRLHCAPPPSCFTGDTAMLDLAVTNPSGRPRRDVAIALADASALRAEGGVDLAPHATALVLLPMLAVGKGLRPLPALRLETRHPLGLVRVRATWTPRADWRILVRPRPF